MTDKYGWDQSGANKSTHTQISVWCYETKKALKVASESIVAEKEKERGKKNERERERKQSSSHCYMT